MDKPKIFVFINGGQPEWYPVSALAEDGHFLAGHLCSHEGYVKHDMGFTSDWKHEHYNKHYPDGWELVYVPPDRVKARDHEGLEAAYAKHLELGEKEKAEKEANGG